MSSGGGELYPEDLRDLVEGALADLHFATAPRTVGLEEAMRYSLLAGGKRVRPVLALATARALGARGFDRDEVDVLVLRLADRVDDLRQRGERRAAVRDDRDGAVEVGAAGGLEVPRVLAVLVHDGVERRDEEAVRAADALAGVDEAVASVRAAADSGRMVA